MQFTYSSTDTIVVKTKTEPITIGATLQLDGFTVPGPGEYDVASIACEGRAMESGAFVYGIRTEDLTITYLTKLDKEVNKLDGVANTNVLVLDLRSEDEAGDVKAIVKVIEPQYLALIGAGATEKLITDLGFPIIESSLKITRAGLPLEGTSILKRD